ncbi:NAD-binding protein [Nocardiopsis sp. HNM0947]|uniref:NAD-binding protein n=1 Tax=Nocardiopsis coralli TaxID=2772213 RepID=A0ABR9P4X4_9ACTN|nr:NAD(P)-binding domain-containing protein [Nocardiopsis coralli]MBE2998884.1 NAD-binding protein [Nocardiopsis coralli]
MLEDFERTRIASFFARIVDHNKAAPETPDPHVSTVAVTHVLAGQLFFLHAVAALSDLRAVLPKPRSVDPEAAREAAELWQVDELDRATFATAEHALAYLESRTPDERVVLLDVGGYFAPSLDEVCAGFSGQILGVVEGTENGHRRYLARDELPCPVYSVARSPLKDPEDYLVGQSVVFSTEALIRARGDLLYGLGAAVLGFGKLGSSVARMLHSRGIQVTVFDIDPVKRAQALAQGFTTVSTLDKALYGAGIVVCATGNRALGPDDFPRVGNGAYIASVTSSDDELRLDGLGELYNREAVGEGITRYARTGHYFYVLNDGNAVNFLHGANSGAFIYLVQAEILAAAARLMRLSHEPDLHELPDDVREQVAAIWLEFFNAPG